MDVDVRHPGGKRVHLHTYALANRGVPGQLAETVAVSRCTVR